VLVTDCHGLGELKDFGIMPETGVVVRMFKALFSTKSTLFKLSFVSS